MTFSAAVHESVHGTLAPSTAVQQSRQLWEGRADSKLDAVDGQYLTPLLTSRTSAHCDAASRCNEN